MHSQDEEPQDATDRLLLLLLLLLAAHSPPPPPPLPPPPPRRPMDTQLQAPQDATTRHDPTGKDLDHRDHG